MAKLSPGERAEHWGKALMTVWPIILVLAGGAVYGNVDTVKTWIHGPGETAPVNQTLSDAFNKINDKFDELEKLINKTAANARSRDNKNYNSLKKEVEAIQEFVN